MKADIHHYDYAAFGKDCWRMWAVTKGSEPLGYVQASNNASAILKALEKWPQADLVTYYDGVL